MRDYENLVVWRAAMDLTVGVYSLLTALPASERFGLTSQLQRAAVAVASNIAEGAGRSTQREFARFVSIASGSASETMTQLALVQRLYGIDSAALIAEARQIRRMLWGLHRQLTDSGQHVEGPST